MIKLLTKLEFTCHQRVHMLDWFCTHQRATIRRQAALVRQPQAAKRGGSAQAHRLLVVAQERVPTRTMRRECAPLLKAEGMPRTNNLAERCLRRAVIWRKKCFGTDSESGSRFVARILSAVTTLKLQRRPVFEFLVQAREAHVRGATPPSLCPTT